MATRWREQQMQGVADLTMRYAAWVRLPMLIPLVFAGLQVESRLVGPWYFPVLAVYALWAVARLVRVQRQLSVRAPGVLAAALIDVAAVTALAALSGGPDSQARYTYYVLPMANMLWQLPQVTAMAGGLSVIAYTAMAVPEVPARAGPRLWQLLGDAAFLVWDIGVCVLIAYLLRRRGERVSELLDNREALLRDTLAAEARERGELADALHDSAVQNLLAALHDLEDVEAETDSPALARAEGEVRRTVKEIRDVTFDLHPQVLEAAGLAAALEAAGERYARRGGFQVHYDFAPTGRVEDEPLLYSTARELLNNIVKHAGASQVWIALRREGQEIVLGIRDDGKGFDTDLIQQRLREGHIGLASHYVRVESAGGRFSVDSEVGEGTEVEVRLPYRAVAPSPS